VTSEPVVRVEGLSKRYFIGSSQGRYRTLRDSLSDLATAPFKRTWRLLRGQSTGAADLHEALWALRDVSFEVRPGEVLGVIGRNGSGKSTLLKVLSRITEPTEGRVRIRGRVGSLLEVGTGFHPELTGRDNVYLNGAILGMKRDEIDQRFDEIVEFAEISKFLDTPVKHYSSGMYVRLAFAVAAHMDTEILLVDEVLSVGDVAFQKKSTEHMAESTKTGRTVLFVSHNLPAVLSLCNRCLLLDQGCLVQAGPVGDVVEAYQQLQSTGLVLDEHGYVNLHDVERYGSGRGRFTGAHVVPLDGNSQPSSIFRTGQDLEVEVSIESITGFTDANVALVIYDLIGYRLVDVNTALQGRLLSLEPGQKARIRFWLRNLLLKPGSYHVGLWLGKASGEDIDGITYFTRLHVDIDPRVVKHQHIYPGPYQCQFEHQIVVSE
jgi:lipopolysaccharide transport system ATP-binding protein